MAHMSGIHLDEVDEDNTVDCPTCNMDIQRDLWSLHLLSPFHARKDRFSTYARSVKDAEKGRFGVSIPEEIFDFGVVETGSLRSRPTVGKRFPIDSNDRAVQLVEVRTSSSVGSLARFRQVNFNVRTRTPLSIRRGSTAELEVSFDPQGNPGEYDDRLELIFEDQVRRFVILRTLRAVVGNRADLALLAPTAPYKPPTKRKKEPETEVVDGVQPPQLARISWARDRQLPTAEVPTWLEALIRGGTMATKLAELRSTALPRTLNPASYGRHWQTILWLEEIQAEEDMLRYDQENVTFASQNYRYFYLEVPGLAEKRPSVIIGDKIKVRNHKQRNDRWFRGYVHLTEMSQVALAFDQSFDSHRGQRYDVRFELNRLVIRRMHQAVTAVPFNESRILFPTASDVTRLRLTRPTPTQLQKYIPFDRKIATNPQQWLAVTAIVEQRTGAVPFIVFGPPGTGKTVVLVEAIRQLVTNRTAKILACAPSNSAADIIAERLSRILNKNQLLRLNAPTRDKGTVPRSLLDYSSVNSDNTFSVPPVEKLKTYRVVVSTCMSASVLYGIGMPLGHFTHIFVDETGQATEPEVMIPIKLNAGPQTNVIIAGDPKQLGPITRSPIAERLGLNTSWLDRLMALPIYEPRNQNGITVVKLLKNWRSHNSILRFPNQEFYANELEACADPIITHSCLRWEDLPKRNFPIIFHAVKGKDERQASSPSFFNITEASTIRDYVWDLRSDSGLMLDDSLIGVISPYNAQCQQIRKLLRQQHPGVKVGSVEEFQGQERRVILISTVRSSVDYVEYDIRHTLGFVANARRFNVAVTRAQALLIIVGDPDVLGLDPLWRSFLNYVHSAGGWKGLKPSWDPSETVERDPPTMSYTARLALARSGRFGGYDVQTSNQAEDDMNALIARTKAMVLDNMVLDEMQEEEAEIRRMEAVADRPWREDE